MPKLSLWNHERGNNYKFFDRQSKKIFDMGGTCVYLHKYLGPKLANNQASNETTIEDLVFLENRSRKYDEFIYELRGHYNPENSDFDLTQFGLFLSNDYIFIEFHLNDHVDKIGRKIITGDVLELPHLREFYTLDDTAPALNRYFVVEDAFRASTGYSATWMPHIWRVKAKALSGGEEFSDILGKQDGSTPGRSGSGDVPNLFDVLSTQKTDLAITAGVVEEAACNVPYDPPFMEGHHYYVYNDENGIPIVHWHAGDGVPPNGATLLGTGTQFPKTMQDKEYFLRTDFNPPTLFQKHGCKFIRIEVDGRKCPWTAANRGLDTYIKNDNITTLGDGSQIPERQALSKVLKPKDGG